MALKEGKIIILSAPSGTGKSSIIKNLITDATLRLCFSISATSRKPRGEEKDGVDYYFLSNEEFKEKVSLGEFVEWEEVYAGTCYGTLESEVKRITSAGNNLIMDIDVKGALNVKKRFGNRALSIFVLPPSKEELERRLRGRATDSDETIAKRLAKADYELSFADKFDTRVVNDDLHQATEEVRRLISDFSK
ncbi:MAG: guanylate kinase [Bacteroidales bacterium]|nr:guanylate kinase [Bacteroidales bacterium]MBD5209132.1 guanylate kinase [Bacteroidales bacterium]